MGRTVVVLAVDLFLAVDLVEQAEDGRAAHQPAENPVAYLTRLCEENCSRPRGGSIHRGGCRRAGGGLSLIPISKPTRRYVISYAVCWFET